MSRTALLVLLQILIQPGLAGDRAADKPGNTPVHYRLDDTASYQQVCLEPCRCPQGPVTTMRGTFDLGPVMPGDVFDFRAVTALHWTLVENGEIVGHISGDGFYKVTNFSRKRQQILELNLSIDGAAPVYFFSDLEALQTNEPVIALPVSKNGLYCKDTVLNVVATPVATGRA